MSLVRLSCLLLLGGLISGCTSAPSPTAAKKPVAKSAASAPASTTKSSAASAPSASATSTAAPKAVLATTAAPVAPKPTFKLSPEAAATVARLTQGSNPAALQHQISASTDFPEAMRSLQTGADAPKVDFADDVKQPPVRGLTADGNSTALVERDWTGLVLVPINTSLSKAHTSEVRLLKVEAHPLSDGRVRVWARVENVENQSVPSRIACSFHMHGEGTPASPYFYSLQVPGRNYRDVFFISPEGELTAYTVLVGLDRMAMK